MNLAFLAVFAAVYTLVYIFLAVNVIGMEGRGPLIFAAPFRPFGLPWLFLLIAVFLSRDLSPFRSRIAFVLLMVIHYAVSTFYVIPYIRFDSSAEGEALIRVMELRPYAVYYAVIWYLAGQIVLWGIFVKGLLKGIRVK